MVCDRHFTRMQVDAIDLLTERQHPDRIIAVTPTQHRHDEVEPVVVVDKGAGGSSSSWTQPRGTVRNPAAAGAM